MACHCPPGFPTSLQLLEAASTSFPPLCPRAQPRAWHVEWEPTEMCGHPFFSVHTPLLTAGLYPQPTRNRLLATVGWTTGTLVVGHCHLNEKLLVLRLQAPWRQHTLGLVKVRALQGKRREHTERRGDGRGQHSSNESWLFFSVTNPLSLGRAQVPVPCNQRLPEAKSCSGVMESSGFVLWGPQRC